MLESERTCRRLKTGGCEWTPEVTSAYRTIQYIKMVNRKLAGGKVGTRILTRWRRMSGNDHISAHSKQVWENKLRESIKRFRELKLSVIVRRQIWLDKRLKTKVIREQQKEEDLRQ